MRISDWSSDVCSSDLIHRSTILPPQRIERDLSEACFVKFNLRAALVIGEPTARCVRFDPHPCNASDARRAAVLRQRYQHVEGIATERSEERRGGKEGVSTCRSRVSPCR